MKRRSDTTVLHHPSRTVPYTSMSTRAARAEGSGCGDGNGEPSLVDEPSSSAAAAACQGEASTTVGALSALSLNGTEANDTRNTNADGGTKNKPPNTKLRVKIKRWHAVARWTWNVGNNTSSSLSSNPTTTSGYDPTTAEEEELCTICQSAFEGVAPGVKYPGDECPVVWGKCGHSFHLTCVSTWLADKNNCPYCRAEWEFGADQAVSTGTDENDEEEEAVSPDDASDDLDEYDTGGDDEDDDAEEENENDSDDYDGSDDVEGEEEEEEEEEEDNSEDEYVTDDDEDDER